MRRLLAWAMPLWGLLMLLAAAAPAGAQAKEKVHRDLQADHVTAVLKELGIKFKLAPATKEKGLDLEFERNNYNIRLKLQGKLLSLAAYFPKVKLDKINEWNQ